MKTKPAYKTKSFAIVLIAVLLQLFFNASSWAGPVYVYKQADGTTRFSSKPPKGVDAQVFTAGQKGFSYYRSHYGANRRERLFFKEYSYAIRRAAYKYRVSPDLIRAVIHAESAFNPKAVSRKGACGLMQLMDSTMDRVGVSDPFSPAENIEGGVRLLAILIKKYDGNLRLTLAAYNAGEGAVEKYGGIPPYSETKDYIKRVLLLQSKYRNALYD